MDDIRMEKKFTKWSGVHLFAYKNGDFQATIEITDENEILDDNIIIECFRNYKVATIEEIYQTLYSLLDISSYLIWIYCSDKNKKVYLTISKGYLAGYVEKRNNNETIYYDNGKFYKKIEYHEKIDDNIVSYVKRKGEGNGRKQRTKN